MANKKTAREILEKYSRKLEGQVDYEKKPDIEAISNAYKKFKADLLPRLTRYERWCQNLGNLIKINLAEKDKQKIQRKIDVAHLELTPSQTATFAIIISMLVFFAGVFLSVGIFFITGNFPILFLFLILITALFLFYYLFKMPDRFAKMWQLKAGSQMVPAVLYIVAYMKHTSNLERAVAFAAEYLEPPLSLDFKKVFWDIQTGRFSTIKESLDSYLETWRENSPEFVESFHLIESSLYEPSEARRVEILEKSLQVILDGVFEKTLKYTHSIRSPLTNLYMLGIVLPTLALALLPLASTLLGDLLRWYHVFVLFCLIIPFFVFYLTSEIMMKRPGGYGETELLEKNPLYPKYKSKMPYLVAFLICFPLFLVGIAPLIFQYTGIPGWFGLEKDFTFGDFGFSFFSNVNFFDFKEVEGAGVVGPFGLVALLLSLFVPLSIGLFFAISYKMKTRELIKAREETKKLETEFASSLFQLGNRLGDGIPAEIAFAKIADSTKGQITGDFFKIVNLNIQQQGMSVEKAIFDKRRGAIIYYPSALISTSMKILIESVKKGLGVAARSLMSISNYIKNIHKINERLRDLLAEISSDMKSNMTFLAPLLSGIVVGLASMITTILNNLSVLLTTVGEQEVAGLGSLSTILSIFDLTKMVPPYYLQIAIGIYLIEIIFILTKTLVTVDAGEDKLKEVYETGRNLKFGMILYIITSFVAIVALSILASIALGGLTG